MRTRELFTRLGFEEDWEAITDERPAYKFDFGNMELTAAQVMSRHFVPVFYCGGAWSTSREIALVEFELPLDVDSFEQGVALIAYFLRNRFRPAEPVPWLESGRQWRDQLPWEKRMASFRQRARCTVEKEWFRLAAKRLREASAGVSDDALAAFSFDGQMLSIGSSALTVGLPARGTAWSEIYNVKAKALATLPRRLVRDVSVSIWEGRLTVGNRSFRLLEDGHISHQPATGAAVTTDDADE